VKLLEQGVEIDIPEESAATVATRALVIGGEGGRMGAFPRFFGFSEVAFVYSASMLTRCSGALVDLMGIIFP